jgi:large subunit ribosomal protein L30
MAYAVIRVRGQPDVNRDIEFTMGLLGLNRVNHCVVVPENPSTKGMLQVVKDYCTWGEVNQETLAAMIRLTSFMFTAATKSITVSLVSSFLRSFPMKE